MEVASISIQSQTVTVTPSQLVALTLPFLPGSSSPMQANYFLCHRPNASYAMFQS